MNLCQSKLYFSLLCVVVFKCCLAANDYENTACRTSGVIGRCKQVPDCPLALDSLKRIQTHNFKRCGFDGLTEIVCCPGVTVTKLTSDEDAETTNTVQQSRFTKRRCDQACDELSNDLKSKVDFHILGGEDAGIEEFPHMAALGYETEEGTEWDCSASVISKYYLLTAAHCIANKNQLKPKKARLGVTKLDETDPQDYLISNITLNPRYNSLTKHNDIALLRVNREIKFSKKVYPSCLYSDPDDPLGLIVTGWGKTTISSRDDRSNTLQKARLDAVPIKECNISYFAKSSGTNTIVGSQLCAWADKRDACLGDSGGPLQIQNKMGSYSVVGIVSYGSGCGGKTAGVYTRVSKYLDWIESIVWS